MNICVNIGECSHRGNWSPNNGRFRRIESLAVVRLDLGISDVVRDLPGFTNVYRIVHHCLPSFPSTLTCGLYSYSQTANHLLVQGSDDTTDTRYRLKLDGTIESAGRWVGPTGEHCLVYVVAGTRSLATSCGACDTWKCGWFSCIKFHSGIPSQVTPHGARRSRRSV